MGDGAGRHGQRLGDIVDAQFLVQELIQDFDSRGISEDLVEF